MNVRILLIVMLLAGCATVPQPAVISGPLTMAASTKKNILVVLAQPGEAKNPMKIVKIFFREPDYYIHGTDKEGQLGGPASHGCIRMAQADVYDLAAFLMQHDGAAHDNSWYADVIRNVKTEDVRLPHSVPLVIGK